MVRSVRQTRFAAIDFESAGTTRGSTDHPIQIGLACWELDQLVSNPFTSYIFTDQPVQWSAQKVHGISSCALKDAPMLHELWPEIRRRLDGAVVVAHGKGTEKRFLRAFPGHGFGPWLDTLTLSRAVWPCLKSHSLSQLCDALHITDEVRVLVSGKTWHDALFDAVASLVLLRKAIQSLNLEEYPIEELLRPNTSNWRRSRMP